MISNFRSITAQSIVKIVKLTNDITCKEIKDCVRYLCEAFYYDGPTQMIDFCTANLYNSIEENRRQVSSATYSEICSLIGDMKAVIPNRDDE